MSELTNDTFCEQDPDPDARCTHALCFEAKRQDEIAFRQSEATRSIDADGGQIFGERTEATLASPDLRGFCIAVLRVAQEGHDLDGSEIQELGVKFGLLSEVEQKEPCGDSCSCAEYGDFPTTCYWFHKDLIA
jgi:hypothetical protein